MPTELVPDDSAAAELAAHTRLGLAILAVALCSALLLVVATWLGDVPGSAGGPHPLLAGVVFAGLLAALMSTEDAFLNIRLPLGIHGGIVAILTSLTLFFGVSLIEPAPKLPADVEAAFDA